MNSSWIFDYSDVRARKARIAKVFDSKILRLILWTILIASFVGGLYLVILNKNDLGWLTLIIVGPVAMILTWYYGDLRDLAVGSQPSSVSAVLDRRLLALLPRDPSPQDLANAVYKTAGGHFFALRFGLSRDFVFNLSSAADQDAQSVWEVAIGLAQANSQVEVSSACVVAALVFNIKDFDTYLAQYQLDKDAIIAGVSWYDNIQKTLATLKEKPIYGGIGRDLAFGYTTLLNRIGHNMTANIESTGMLHRIVPSRVAPIDQMINTLSQGAHRNVVVVGEDGTGKTTVVYAFTQKLMEDPSVPSSLHYNQVIELDAATLIANAKDKGELESLMIQLLNEAIRAKNTIIFLDEAQLFLREGTGSVDLNSVLLPVLQNGGVRLILAMDQQEWLSLSQANPGLAQLMNRVVLPEPSPEGTMTVMQDQVLLLEAQYKVVYLYQSLAEAYRLAERYIRDQAFPRRGVKVLEAAANFAENGLVTAHSVQQAVENSFDVKVATPSSTEERDVLLNLEGRIHERMINQTHAVGVVADALRRAASGVRNEKRPIGTFLFLGPTGVGKTELAKSLAEVYFNGEDRLVRVDLNEYSGADDVQRLLAVGASNSASLCAQIAKQPFSVVLLDEIEKAHDNVLNVLLQLLDEGILRDSDNKEVSFRDAIIIATSNAGADIIRQHIEQGEQLEQFEEAFVNQLIDSNQFRPEFLNRFDEIVLFRPLNQTELVEVVDLLIKGVNKSLENQKISVNLTIAAKQFLAGQGYDPRLGARPMRRMVQRTVENVVARQLLQQQITPGSVLELDEPDLKAVIDQAATNQEGELH